jgi:1,4-dihydroxy-2-naphthoate octaprenyltransferase
VIQEGLIAPRAILTASLASLALGGCLGLFLNALTPGNVVLALGLAGVALGYSYSAGPMRLGYRGLGEAAVGLGFGPLMVAGSYYVQAEGLSGRVVLISLPVAILIALVLLINGFPDRDADLAVGKRTLVVLLGKARAVAVYHALLAAAYVSLALLIGFRALPPISLIVFLSLPLAWRAYLVSREHYDRIGELLPANAATIVLHSLIGVLLIVGLALDRLV